MDCKVILVLGVLLLGIVGAVTGPFNSFKVILADTDMKQIAKDVLQASFYMLGNTTFKSKVTERSIILKFVTITNHTSDPKVDLNLDNFTSNFEGGVYTITFENPFKLKSTFISNITVQDAFVIKREGAAFIEGTKMTLVHDYRTLIPESEFDLECNIKAIEFKGGLLTNAVIAIVKDQFKEVLKELRINLKGYVKLFDPLLSTEVKGQQLNDGNIVFVKRESVIAKNESKAITRLVKSKLGVEDENMEQDIDCDYDNVVNENQTVLCFCSYLFPKMLVAGSKPREVNITDWDLKGKVMELYDVIPELINNYSPDTDFKVEVTENDCTKGDNYTKSFLNKTYNFKVGSVIILSVETKFSITLEGELKDGHFRVKQTDVSIINLGTDLLIEPSGKIPLARFMMHEMESMKGTYMFSEGLLINKIPQAAQHSRLNTFCVSI